jgi:protocatechuate 3,4-dioxygenase, beta subunit
MKFTRRQMMQLLVTLPVASGAFISTFTRGQAAKLLPTPQDVEGPYYPKTWSGEVDNDLTTFNGKKYTRGIPLTITGRVQSVDGTVLKNALVEIWQIDDAGEYRHPDFGGEGPANRGFQGYGRMRTDEDGRFVFNTIKPVAYSGRPPHVHFKVIADSHIALITEMYFAGENKEGSFYNRVFGGFSKERDRLTVTTNAQRNGDVNTLSAVFNLILARAVKTG